MAQNPTNFGMDVDNMMGNDPFQFLQGSGRNARPDNPAPPTVNPQSRNTALFDQYTASLGIGAKPAAGGNSVEEYAALMGVKLNPGTSQQRPPMRGGPPTDNMTSMTMPSMSMNFMSMPPPNAASQHQPPMGKPPMHPSDIGSRTLDPQVLQTMIQSNVQNGQFMAGNTTWPPRKYLSPAYVIRLLNR